MRELAFPPAPAGAEDRHAATGVGRRAAFALLALLPLAACGRNGRPEPPPDADPSFPRRYPSN
jgi:hypothetical protein